MEGMKAGELMLRFFWILVMMGITGGGGFSEVCAAGNTALEIVLRV